MVGLGSNPSYKYNSVPLAKEFSEAMFSTIHWQHFFRLLPLNCTFEKILQYEQSIYTNRNSR